MTGPVSVANRSVRVPISAVGMPDRNSGSRISVRHQSDSVSATRRMPSPATRRLRSIEVGLIPAAMRVSRYGMIRSSFSRRWLSGSGWADPVASRTTSRRSTGMPVRSAS